MLASDDVDPLEDIAASTVAMIILFGSLTFATVSMMTRILLLGDKRGACLVVYRKFFCFVLLVNSLSLAMIVHYSSNYCCVDNQTKDTFCREFRYNNF